MTTVTDEQVKEVLREVVSERPEYVYSAPEYMAPARIGGGTCFYVHNDEDGTPVSAGCVVGVVLQRLGVPLAAMAEREGEAALNMVPRLLKNISPKMVNVLDSVQSYQDEKTPWGESYAKATGETI